MSEILITPDGNIHQLGTQAGAQQLPEQEWRQQIQPPAMSLRDWFAGQAIVSFAADYTATGAALKAYEIADAMLEQRKK